MTEERENKKIRIVWIILGYVILCLIITCFFKPEEGLFGQKIPFVEWVLFIGSYLGGVLGGFGTLLAMYFTIQNSLDIQESDREQRRYELTKQQNRELVNSVAEYLGKYITHISNYDNNVTTAWSLKKVMNRSQAEYNDVVYKQEQLQFEIEQEQDNIRLFQLNEKMKELRNQLDGAKSAFDNARKDFNNYEKYSEHIEANEAYFVIKTKLSHVWQAKGLIACLDDVHHNVGQDHEPRLWIDNKVEQLINEFNLFSNDYMRV